MKVINARNAHQALALGLEELFKNGVQRDSRNGPVLQSPVPVTTVYDKPTERVVFWSQRDANPFFHLYEALWMLAGRNDVEGPAKYAKQMREYSDDGETFHGAYGYRWRSYRWRNEFLGASPTFAHADQLPKIIKALRKNRDDRRQVLQMWDAVLDLGGSGKDLPCNLTATFQINTEGHLDLTVFNRSNDIVWGCYGANAVHFSILLEYVAMFVGVPVGRYYQVSVNWHGYLDTVSALYSIPEHARFDMADPYTQNLVESVPLMLEPTSFDVMNSYLLEAADNDALGDLSVRKTMSAEPFFTVAHRMLLAHQVYRTGEIPEKYDAALDILGSAPLNVDWIRAGKEWIQRRKVKANARTQQA